MRRKKWLHSLNIKYVFNTDTQRGWHVTMWLCVCMCLCSDRACVSHPQPDMRVWQIKMAKGELELCILMIILYV